MARTVTISPVTRIEGHAKITIQLDDAGEVRDAALHITQFRGFEAICQGRTYAELPSIMARICGICPVSHLVASGKACDALLAVQIPPAAASLRRVLNLAQLIQSHALSFFYLASPDLLLGMEADPAERNILHLAQTHPELARGGVRLRQIGQEIIAGLAGRRIHPGWVVPGGVNAPLTADRRDAMLAMLPEGLAIAERTLDWYSSILPGFADEIAVFANFPTLYLAQTSPTGDGTLEHYDGPLRFIDAAGHVVADRVEPANYAGVIGEAVEPWTFLKFPYYLPLGYPDGMYRVGPLARLNIAERAGTPRADTAFAAFRALADGPVQSSFHYHQARLVEIIYGLERIGELLSDDAILSQHVRAEARPNRLEGIGVAEAPRGTLLHHYRIDENGLVQWINLIIATGHNNLAMNRGVAQVARHYVRGEQLQEGMLNRVEAVIRTYDPCLSCSTHALGQMPLWLELRGPAGELLDQLRRD